VTAAAAAALPSLAIYGAPPRQPPAHLGLAGAGGGQYAPPAAAQYSQHNSGAMTERSHRTAPPAAASAAGGVMAALADVRALFPPLAPLSSNSRTRRC
jgi:hypothetical protein